jgi:hypothetical protein
VAVILIPVAVLHGSTVVRSKATGTVSRCRTEYLSHCLLSSSCSHLAYSCQLCNNYYLLRRFLVRQVMFMSNLPFICKWQVDGYTILVPII